MKKLLLILLCLPLLFGCGSGEINKEEIINNNPITSISKYEKDNNSKCDTPCECLELVHSELKNIIKLELINKVNCDSCHIRLFNIFKEAAKKNYTYYHFFECDNFVEVDSKFTRIFGYIGLKYHLEKAIEIIQEEVIKQQIDIIPIQPITENPTVKKTEKKEEVIKEESLEEVIEEKKPKINKKALYQGKKENFETSEGENNEEGNQGIIEGDPGASGHEGRGIGKDGTAYQLGGRNAEFKPKPIYEIQAEGKVVVIITVDRSGNVINAIPGTKGSTTLNKQLLQSAKAAALKTKFNPKQSAPTNQQGEITFYFGLY